MAAISLFWDTNMVAVTSFEHSLLVYIVCILVKVMKIFSNIFFTEKKNLKRSASLPGMSDSVSAVIVGMMIRTMAARLSIKQYIQISKTTTLHVQHSCFFVYFFAITAWLQLEIA